MKYAIIKIINDSFSIDSEWDSLDKTIVRFHTVCSSLWNSQEVETATLVIMDSKMRPVGGYTERIHYDN